MFPFLSSKFCWRRKIFVLLTSNVSKVLQVLDTKRKYRYATEEITFMQMYKRGHKRNPSALRQIFIKFFNLSKMFVKHTKLICISELPGIMVVSVSTVIKTRNYEYFTQKHFSNCYLINFYAV